MRRLSPALAVFAALVVVGCAGVHRPEIHLISYLVPDQEESPAVCGLDSSGTWVCQYPGFLLAVRHEDDQTLNRRFPEVSFRGSESANPFTYGNWVDPELGYVPPRFTVFRVGIRNQAADSVHLDLDRAFLKTDRADSLPALNLDGPKGLTAHYRKDWPDNGLLVATAKGLAEASLLPNVWLKAGAEASGEVVFPYLDPAVYRVTLWLPVVMRTSGSLDTVRVELGFKQKLKRVDRPVAR